MDSKNILNITPERILVKEPFRRVQPSQRLTQAGQIRPSGDFSSVLDIDYDPLRFDLYSQADFIREFDINAHAINSVKYMPNQLTIEKGGNNAYKMYNKIKSRFAVSWQSRIFTKRLASLTGNNIDLSIANAVTGKNMQDILALFREGWIVKNMENALYEAFSSDGKTGDCAIAFYMVNGELGWRSFGYEKGDTLYPHYDPMTGRLAILGRKYAELDENGEPVEKLEVWDDTFYARYAKTKKVETVEGKDRWVVEQEAIPHNFTRIPVAYDRYGEPFWANSQSLIEGYEMAMSQLAENNMAYALRILTLLGGEMDLKRSADGTPTVINAPDPNAKVGFLEPADSSKSFELQLEKVEKNIMRSSFAVETPEIHSGSDMSSLTVKMLFADSYQKALEDGQHFQPFLTDVIAIFKEGYGKEIGKISDFNVLKVKAEIIPWIFMSESEVVSNIVQLRGCGAMSKRSASDQAFELGYGTIDEAERVAQEEHDALLGQAQVERQKNVNVVSNARNA